MIKQRVCECGHSSSEHTRGRYFCQSQDIYDADWKCNCDWYESRPDGDASYCDDCIMAVADEGVSGTAEQYEVLAIAGSGLPDHRCSRMAEPSTKCDCKGH